MTKEIRFRSRGEAFTELGCVFVSYCPIAWSSCVSSVAAQYVYNPAAADEQPGIRYFGSAKDDNGALLPDVSIIVGMAALTHFLVTDNQGRFRITLPLDMVPDLVKIQCFKEGFQFVRINKRLGPTGPRQTVQVDCALHTSASSRTQ